jgi:hypothetical protein
VPLARVGLAAAALSPRQDPATLLVGFADFDLGALRKPLIDAWGVRYAALAGESGKPVKGWNIVFQGRLQPEFTLRGRVGTELPYVVYENIAPMPRAYVLGRATVMDPRADPVRQLAELDPRHAVLLEADVLAAGPRQTFREATVVQHTPARVTVTAELDASGYLVLADVHYPGWTARVDGEPVPLVPANLAFRAVPLGAGRHSVEFSYAPPGLHRGLFLTVLTVWLALAGRRMLDRRATNSFHG